jgi:Cu2+-exporting ATPase
MHKASTRRPKSVPARWTWCRASERVRNHRKGDPPMNEHDMHTSESHAHAGHGQSQPARASGHEGMAHSARRGSGDGHTHVDHTGHEQMFRRRFWISLLLSIPVLVFSPSIQGFLGYNLPEFPGSRWITPVFSVIVFLYGGLPFLQMSVPELRNRKPGMMTLISLAISVAFVYSLAAFILRIGTTFFWELVTLIDIMLLGHWLEMRSVRQASGALNELAKLMPDTAERVREDGTTQEVSVDELE